MTPAAERYNSTLYCALVSVVVDNEDQVKKSFSNAVTVVKPERLLGIAVLVSVSYTHLTLPTKA